MSNSIKQYILDLHNEKRQKIANGQDKILKGLKVSNMNELSWSAECAETAKCWANQCESDHDKCRDTATGQYVGQNYAGFGGYGNVDFSNIGSKDRVKGMFDNWVSEEEDLVIDDLWDYQERSYVGHYTQVIWANTSQVGCGWVNFLEFENGQKWYNMNLYCNYLVGGNWIGSPVFKKGKPASDCKFGESSKYSGLCNSDVSKS